jgi:hypothetical protein
MPEIGVGVGEEKRASGRQAWSPCGQGAGHSLAGEEFAAAGSCVAHVAAPAGWCCKGIVRRDLSACLTTLFLPPALFHAA